MGKTLLVRAAMGVVGLALLVPFATPAAAGGGLDPLFGDGGTVSIAGPTGWTLRPMALAGDVVVAVEATRPSGSGRVQTGVGLVELFGSDVSQRFNAGQVRLVATGSGVAFRGLDSTVTENVVLTDRAGQGFRVDWVDHTGVARGSNTFPGIAVSAAVESVGPGAARVCYASGGRGRLASVSVDGPAVEIGNLPADFPACRVMANPFQGDKLVLAGYTEGHSEIVVVRTDLNGVLDPTFGVGGVARIARPDNVFQVRKIGVEKDGIYLAGLTQQTTGSFDPAKPSLVAVHKVGLDGKPARNWGRLGVKRYQLRSLLAFDVVAYRKLVVGGIAAESRGTTEYRLYRADRATGRTDPRWGRNGYVVPPSAVVDTQSDYAWRLTMLGYPQGGVATIVQRRRG
jgi:hypothetical protein